MIFFSSGTSRLFVSSLNNLIFLFKMSIFVEERFKSDHVGLKYTKGTIVLVTQMFIIFGQRNMYLVWG